MRVLVLTRYGRLGASSRLRFLQYVPYLEAKGWQLEVLPLFSNRYLKALYAGKRGRRLREILEGYARRLARLLTVRRYNLVWIEKELFPFMPAWLEWVLNRLAVPYVVDYDDALFHQYDSHRLGVVRALLGRKVDRVMRRARLVVAGNGYLADRAQQAGAQQVEIVPTVVDLTRYQPRPDSSDGPPVVGWIGTPKTVRYLYELRCVWERLQAEQDVRFVAVGPRPEDVAGTPWKVVPWSEAGEAAAIRSFDIGIMPLPDSPWERGKCGYKLIQYMACGLPVVASPVGVNREIVAVGTNGYLADSDEAWIKCLYKLVRDETRRRHFGQKGRDKIADWYAMQVQAPRLAQMLAQAGGQ